MSENLVKGGQYKGFDVLDVFPLADYHSTAFHLLHRATGMELVHLLNGDDENLFSFAFRTPNETGNGAAHILEHSVLCGSERFPLKDPFVTLSNQSVKTYLNAMTYPDRTVFPASSIVKADYFNLMRVYGDAVFFPLLSPEIFMQEAHRLELDESGAPSIQGVVYNEMKGNYSSFDSVASDSCTISVLGGSVYATDSGGDPLEIPSITHEALVAFHKKWYRPDNCFVFLYGNIPTAEQLDFLQEHFLGRLERQFPVPRVRGFTCAEFLPFVQAPALNAPMEVCYDAPCGETERESGNTVVVNWRLGTTPDARTYMALTIVCGILANHEGSPLQKALLESGLGEDVAPQTGLSGYIYDSIFSVGLRGVKAGDEKKVEAVIFDTLRKIAAEGVSVRDIDSILMTLEFSHREIKRSGGPYSLVLMNRALYGWLYGYDIQSQFRVRSILESLKAEIKADAGYVQRAVTSLFLENDQRSLVVVRPSEAYSAARAEAEQALIGRLMAQTTPGAVRAASDALHEFQSKADDDSCLPHLNPQDFIVGGKPVMNVIATEIESLPGADGSEIPFFVNRENTNGILYADVGFPADVLAPADYLLLPSFADCATACGWKELGWAESLEECSLHAGSFSAGLVSSDVCQTARSLELKNRHGWCGREWVVFRISMIEEEIPAALKILADCLSGADFRDEKRVKDVVTESRNDFDASVLPNGHLYAGLRAECRTTRCEAVDELWNGISQLFAVHALSERAGADIAAEFRRIFAALKAGGTFVHVTGEDSGIAAARTALPALVAEAALTAPKEKRAAPDGEFFALTALDGQAADGAEEVCVIPGQVGFAAECIPASTFCTEEEAAEDVCAHWLSNTLLWEKIRTIGGAYGAFSTLDSSPANFVFSTYRDPSPFSSCRVFEECLREAAEKQFSTEETEKAIMGCYSQWLQPQTPRGRGATGLIRTLYGVSDEDRAQKLRWLLNISPAVLSAAFRRLWEWAAQGSGRFAARKSVLCGRNAAKSEHSSGKIIILPL